MSETKTITLTNGMLATVSAEDFPSLSQYTWHGHFSPSTKTCYAVRRVKHCGRSYSLQMGRQILGLERGDQRQCDHIDHDTLNNTRENLRIATRAENCRNRRRRTDNSSQYKGVSWNKGASKAGRWRVQIWVDGTNKLIGHFTDAIEAARAYDARAREVFGEFACCNFELEQ